MGRIKSIDNALGININVTKEFVHENSDRKTIIGKLTNWTGDNTDCSDWVNLEIDNLGNIFEYSFASSEDEATCLSYGLQFNDVDYETTIDYHNMVEEITGWNYHDGANYNFQTCVLTSYMYYEAIEVDAISIDINGSNFNISGNVYEIDSHDLLFHFKATPGINSYNIDYYNYAGKKIDCLEFANLEASKICGAGNADVDNAIYYVISNAIYRAMADTLPISILVRGLLNINDAHKKDLKMPTAKDYINYLFTNGIIDRFVAEFVLTMFSKGGSHYHFTV